MRSLTGIPDHFRQGVNQLSRWTLKVSPFLALPGLVLVGLTIFLGPGLWRVAYAYIAGVCAAYLSDVSPASVIADLLLLLTVVALVSGGWGVLREWRRLRVLSRTISRSKYSSASEANTGCPVLVVDDAEPLAFCYGLLSPKICYSTGLRQLLSKAELRAVLLHEGLHARRRDPLKVFIVRVLASTFFFLPLSRDLRDRYLAWLEVRADAEVVSRLGVAELAQALVKLLQPAPAINLTAAVSPINPTEERVRRLLDPESDFPALIGLGRQSLASLGVTAGTGLMALGIVYSAGALMMAAPFCQISLA